jgi:hypothetical protein
MDERKVRIYTWMVKTGKKTINEIPVDYQESVTNNLPNMNIVDLDKITELEAKYITLKDNLSITDGNLSAFVDYVFETYGI